MPISEPLFFLSSFLEFLLLGPLSVSNKPTAKISGILKWIHSLKFGISLLYFVCLFLAPMSWGITIFIHLVFGLIAAGFQSKKTGPENIARILDRERLKDSLWIGCLLVAPIAFLFSFFMNFMELSAGAMLQPVDVYFFSLFWAFCSLPLGILLGYSLYKSKIPIGVKTFAYCLLALVVILCSYILIQSFFHSFYSRYDIPVETAIFGNFSLEQKWRFYIKIFLVVSYSFLFLRILTSTSFHIKGWKLIRVTFSLIVSMYISALFLSGELCLSMEQFRNWSYNHYHFKTYMGISKLQKLKFPNYVRIPYNQHELAEYLYQTKNEDKAREIFKEILNEYPQSYVKPLKHQITHWMDSWEKNKAKLKPIEDYNIELNLPIIQYADYLTSNWCGILTALSFIEKNPEDLALKEKLLKVFSEDNNQLPSIDNMPSLGPILDRMGIPYSAIFLNDSMLIEAMSQNLVPLIYYNYTWIPIQGYDALRDGFYFLDYSSHFSKYTRKKSVDNLITGTSVKEGNRLVEKQLPKFRKFISRKLIVQHILDIGGIGLVVGETKWPDSKSHYAAYTIEMADMYYQSLNNIPRAYALYQSARENKDNWVVRERISYLKRHFLANLQDVKKMGSVFYNNTGFGKKEVMDVSIELETKKRILQGKAGSILLENWILRKPIPDSSQLDSLKSVYIYLNKINPYKTSYLDSLSNIEYKLGNVENAINYAIELYNIYPNGYPNLALNICWMYLELENMEKVSQWFSLAKGTYYKSKYLAIKGALQVYKGHINRAEKILQESLKEDKTLALTHKWMLNVYKQQGNHQKAAIEEKWILRCEGKI